MIDEYDKNYYLLSCDICGITESGPFESFLEAVEYKKEHKEEWYSVFQKNEYEKKAMWHDVCQSCIQKMPMAKWKYIPDGRTYVRPFNIKPIKKTPEKTDSVPKKQEINSAAESISSTINKRKNDL